MMLPPSIMVAASASVSSANIYPSGKEACKVCVPFVTPSPNGLKSQVISNSSSVPSSSTALMDCGKHPSSNSAVSGFSSSAAVSRYHFSVFLSYASNPSLSAHVQEAITTLSGFSTLPSGSRPSLPDCTSFRVFSPTKLPT